MLKDDIATLLMKLERRMQVAKRTGLFD